MSKPGRQEWDILLRSLAAMFVSAVFLSACGNQAGQDAQKSGPVLPVVVSQAEIRDVPLSFDMVGTTLGTQDVPIRARAEGFLLTMDFQEGTLVTRGDLLYTIDPQPYMARLVEAQSQLAAAQTRLAKAESDLARIRPLAEMKAVSQQDLDGAVAQEAAARAGVRANEAGVELAEIDLSYTKIFAPIDGLIGLTKARPGEFVGRDPNPIVLNTLSDIDPIRVRFSISEREYLVLARTYLATHESIEQSRRVAPDMERQADLTLILADGTEHEHLGHVVAASQAIDQETGTYTIEASFPNPRMLLLPGQFARVRAVYQTLENAVVIPRQAVSELQGLFRVYVVDDSGVVEAREINLGPETGNETVVESGLQLGERVIVEGLQRVRPGMKVQPVPAEPPTTGQD